MKYLRYLCMPFLAIAAIWFGVKGVYWAWIFLALLDIGIILGDAFLGDDTSVPDYKHPWLLTSLVYINLPLYLVFLAIAVYMGGNVSIPVFENMIFALTGQNVAAGRAITE